MSYLNISSFVMLRVVLFEYALFHFFNLHVLFEIITFCRFPPSITPVTAQDSSNRMFDTTILGGIV